MRKIIAKDRDGETGREELAKAPATWRSSQEVCNHGGRTMGPFPHDAPPARISAANPAGTDGFEFVEFAHTDPHVLETLFRRMGYVEVARHKTRDISLFRQGDINYMLNREPNS